MWWISYRGEGKTGVENIGVFEDDGTPRKEHPLLLDPSPKAHPLHIARGFALVGDDLYIANAWRRDSHVARYRRRGGLTMELFLWMFIFSGIAVVVFIPHKTDAFAHWLGVSSGFNDNALGRGVVAHGAPYVTPSRAGRSEGCPAMEPSRAREFESPVNWRSRWPARTFGAN